jgi:hypothetical protein
MAAFQQLARSEAAVRRLATVYSDTATTSLLPRLSDHSCTNKIRSQYDHTLHACRRNGFLKPQKRLIAIRIICRRQFKK